MATKLGVYNLAMGHLEERALATLTEAREPRRAIDAIYTSTVRYCLELGQWKFALRTEEIEASTSVVPVFGFTYAFEKPDDWVRLVGISTSDRFSTPLLEYVEEGDFWYANVTPIYVRFVSDDVTYGLDLGKWPSTFERFVALQLAYDSCGRIAGKESLDERLAKKLKTAMGEARSIDAQNGPPSFPPRGAWANARSRGVSTLNGTKRGLP